MQTRPFLLAAAFLSAVPVVPTLAQAAPATAAAPVAPATAGVTLRYKFTPGQSRVYKFSMDAGGTLTGGPGGQAIPIQQHMEAVMRQTVKDVRASDGAATIQMAYDSLTMTMNGQPLPAQAGEGMKKIGTMLMMPTGKVLSFTPPDGSNAAMMGNMNGMFQNMNQGTFPDGPVKAADKWDSKADVSALGVKIAASNTVASADANAAHYTTVMKGTMDSASTTTPSPLPLTLAGTIDGTSDQTFDVAAGALASQTGTVSMDLTMTPKPGQNAGAPAMGPMKMKMKITTHMDQVPDAPKPTAALVPLKPALSAGPIRLDTTEFTGSRTTFSVGQSF